MVARRRQGDGDDHHEHGAQRMEGLVGAQGNGNGPVPEVDAVGDSPQVDQGREGEQDAGPEARRLDESQQQRGDGPAEEQGAALLVVDPDRGVRNVGDPRDEPEPAQGARPPSQKSARASLRQQEGEQGAHERL